MNLPEHIDSFIRHIMPKMEGWCSTEKAVSLARNVLNTQSSTCVEIGVFAGRSLLAVALALRELGRGKVYGIDPWDSAISNAGWTDQNDPKGANREFWGRQKMHDDVYDQCAAYVASLGLSDYVVLLRKTASEALPTIQGVGEIDFLHIDGNHSEETSLFDVENYVPLVKRGGSVWVDDMDWPTTRGAYSRLLEMAQPEVMVGSCGLFVKH